MTTEDFIITLFCEIDEQLGPLPKNPQATLWPSEIVTIGVLFALKGGTRGFQTDVAMRDGVTLNTFMFLPAYGGPRWQPPWRSGSD